MARSRLYSSQVGRNAARTAAFSILSVAAPNRVQIFGMTHQHRSQCCPFLRRQFRKVRKRGLVQIERAFLVVAHGFAQPVIQQALSCDDHSDFSFNCSPARAQEPKLPRRGRTLLVVLLTEEPRQFHFYLCWQWLCWWIAQECQHQVVVARHRNVVLLHQSQSAIRLCGL
jgi:hypothetical protein